MRNEFWRGQPDEVHWQVVVVHVNDDETVLISYEKLALMLDRLGFQKIGVEDGT